MDVDIRIAHKRDFEKLAHNRWEYLEPDAPVAKGFIKEYVHYLAIETTLQRLVVVIAELGNEIIANACLIIVPKTPKPFSTHKNIGYVTNVYVKQEYRNKSTGTKIMEKIKEIAMENNMELLIVWPSTKSQNFYKRQGFVKENDICELMLEKE